MHRCREELDVVRLSRILPHYLSGMKVETFSPNTQIGPHAMGGETAQQEPSGPWGNQTHAWPGGQREANRRKFLLLGSLKMCLHSLSLFFATGLMGKGSCAHPEEQWLRRSRV